MNQVIAGIMIAGASAPVLASGDGASLVSQVAGGAIAIPEPSNLALLVIGVAGLIIGRRASRNRRRPEDQGLDV